MDALSVLALATQCVTAAPAPVVAAMAIAEANGSVYSVLIEGKRSALSDLDAGVEAAAIGLLNVGVVKIGVASVPTSELDNRSIPYSDAVSACMAIAGDMLREFWSRSGGQDQNWRRAVLQVAIGDRNVEAELAKKFDVAMADVRRAAQGLPRPSSAIETPANRAARNVKDDADTEATPRQPGKPASALALYGRHPSQSL